jgi:hypothetical protein
VSYLVVLLVSLVLSVVFLRSLGAFVELIVKLDLFVLGSIKPILGFVFQLHRQTKRSQRNFGAYI